MTDPLDYLEALADEHEVVRGVFLEGPGAEPVGVLVRAFAQGRGIRIVMEPEPGKGPQLLVEAGDLRKIVNDPQDMPA